MEEIKFTESEQRYFGELFLGCDSDNTGKVPVYKASELFRSANLPIDVLKQITDVCGGNRGAYLGRHQFYLALKLIAAVQAGLPVRIDLLHSSRDVPLPHFYHTNSLERPEVRCAVRPSDSPDLIQLSDTDSTPLRGSVEPGNSSEGEVEPQTDSPCPNGGSPRKGIVSPEASSTASDSPTPTNSVRHGTNHWQGLFCEEQRQLLGTEEESSDRHSSDEDGGAVDIWNITEEQREYYTAQFRSLQPDPQGLIAGPVARTFFEKSRLPVQELRKIWQLADVTKDGALSLQEFNTAMHLVVLRRNNISLPDALPSLLVPHDHHPNSVPSLSPPAEEPSSPPKNKEWTKFVDSPTSSISSPGPKPVNFDFHKSAVEQDPKILHPVPLRLTPESQGIPPVEEEPCRSPRKMTEPHPIPYEQFGNDSLSPKKTTVVVENNVCSSDIRPIQRPQPKKPAAPGPGAIPPPPHPVTTLPIEEVPMPPTGIQSGPTSLPVPHMAPKKEPPPPPPPRPYRTHTRSSSLDLNRMTKTGGGLLGAPPVVPPRTSPNAASPKKLIGQHSEGDVLALAGDKLDFADFAQFGQTDEDSANTSQPRKHGAFEVYRKPIPAHKGSDVNRRHSHDLESPAGNSSFPITTGNASLKKLQEQNMVLTRVCQHLSRELSQVQEEKLALESQIEQLRIQGERSGLSYQNG